MSGYLIGPSGVAPAVIVSSATTWDGTTNIGPNITLSNGNLTALLGTSGVNGVLSLGNHLTGLYYAEFHLDTLGAAAVFIGIANTAETLNAQPGVGGANGIGWNINTGQVWFNGANPTNTPVAAGATGNTISIATDLTNKKIWFRVGAGNWNNNASGDLTNSSGGFGADFGSIGAGPYYVKYAPQNASDQITANFGGSAYLQSEPAGYGNW